LFGIPAVNLEILDVFFCLGGRGDFLFQFGFGGGGEENRMVASRSSGDLLSNEKKHSRQFVDA
jgi:hypothetical protein